MVRVVSSASRHLLRVIVFMAMGAMACAADTPPDVPDPARVDAIFSGLSGHTPGCAVGVMRRGQMLYSHAYGLASLELNVPLSVDSVFGLASMSKQFTGMSVVLLATRGQLALSDPVQKYIPELPDYGVPITVADLLHHTSGLKDYNQLLSFSGVHGADVATPEMALGLVRRQHELNFVPGSEYSYSDTNYFLLGMIVERVSGRSLADFARQEIFDPLGMGHTQFLQDRTKVVPQAATGYRKRVDGWHLAFSGEQVLGSSGVLSTVGDLAKWDLNFYDSKVGGKAATHLMTEPSRLSDGSINAYAAGLEVKHYRGLMVVEHAGDGLGFQTTMLRFPDQGFSVAVLCNVRDQVSPTALAEKVADLYLRADLQPEETPQQAPAYDVSDFKGSVGIYWDGKTDLLREISIKDRRLMQRLLPDDAPRPLRHLSGSRFEAGNGILYEFAPSGSTFTRTLLAGGKSTYRRLPEADLRPQAVGEFVGNFYAESIDTHWQFASMGNRLVLRRRGFPDETLDFEFRDAYLGDLGLFHFLRNDAGAVNGIEVMNYRLGKVRFTREGP